MHRQKGYWRRLIYNALCLVTLITFTACSVKTFPYYAQTPANIPNHQVKNNVVLACDPFIEKERLINLFGVDLLNDYTGDDPGYAVLPIYVSLENLGNDSILLQNSSIQLLLKNEKVIDSSVDGQAASTPRAQALSHRNNVGGTIASVSGLVCIWFMPQLCLPFILGILVASPFLANADRTDASAVFSMKSKNLDNRSISIGQRHSGFVYFLVKNGQVEDFRNAAALRMNVKNLDTNEEIPFSFNMNFTALSD